MMSKEKNQDEKRIARLGALKAVKALDNEDSPWTLTQEIFQDVIAGHVVVNPDRLPPVTQMREELLKEIETRYKEEDELKDLLIESVPEARTMRKWVKKEGWEDAVWDKIRGDQLFSQANRSQMLEALRVRGMDKSDQAAKIWLTISGDYSDKLDVTDKTVDKYREINTILHKRKKEEG